MKKVFAIMFSFIIALVLVGCQKTQAVDPAKTQNVTTQPTTSELTEEEKKELTVKNKKELEAAIDQSLQSAVGTKLSVVFANEVEGEMNASSLLKDTKEVAEAVGALEKYEGKVNLKVRFAITAEVDSEALTMALRINFIVPEFSVHGDEFPVEELEGIKSLFFDEEGKAREFSAYLFYKDKVLYAGINKPVKDAVVMVVNLIASIFGAKYDPTIADSIFPNDENHFMLDVEEYLKAKETETEKTEEELKLDAAKANAKEQLDYYLGKLKGQSVSSLYSAAKLFLGTMGILGEEGNIDFDKLIDFIASALVSMSDTNEESEEGTELINKVKAYISENLYIYKTNDDFKAELEEADYTQVKLAEEDEAAVISYFGVNEEAISSALASLTISYDFNNGQLEKLAVELAAKLAGSDEEEKEFEVETTLEDESTKTEKVKVKYNTEYSLNAKLTSSIEISSTLSLKFEELVPQAVDGVKPEFLDFYKVFGSDLDDFILDNFSEKE